MVGNELKVAQREMQRVCFGFKLNMFAIIFYKINIYA